MHVTQDECMLINVIMSRQLVLSISEHCRAAAQGELFAMTLALKDGKWSKKHFRSGRRNTLLVPTSTRPIASAIQFDRQGHQSQAYGNSPGLVLFGGEGVVPFVKEVQTGFFLMP